MTADEGGMWREHVRLDIRGRAEADALPAGEWPARLVALHGLASTAGLAQMPKSDAYLWWHLYRRAAEEQTARIRALVEAIFA